MAPPLQARKALNDSLILGRILRQQEQSDGEGEKVLPAGWAALQVQEEDVITDRINILHRCDTLQWFRLCCRYVAAD